MTWVTRSEAARCSMPITGQFPVSWTDFSPACLRSSRPAPWADEFLGGGSSAKSRSPEARVAPDAGGDVGALGEAGSTDDEAPRVMPSVQTAYGDLTEWEAEVLLITQGLFGAEVTERLAAAEPTIRAQGSRVLVEPGSPGRTQAAVFPYETRLVRPSGR